MGLMSRLFRSGNAAGQGSERVGSAVLLAPVSGRVVPLSEVPDPVFAQGILGAGCGIEPSDGSVVSPAGGTVTALAPSLHAVGLTDDNGRELLLHVGVDTVKLDGSGFVALVAQGEHVEAGQPLLSFDRAAIAEAGFSDTVMLVVSGTSAETGARLCATGTVAAGDALLEPTE